MAGYRPATLVRKWRRQLQLVTAFEMADVMRHQLYGYEDDRPVGQIAAAGVTTFAKSKYKPCSTFGDRSLYVQHQSAPARQGLSACALQGPLPQFGTVDPPPVGVSVGGSSGSEPT